MLLNSLHNILGATFSVPRVSFTSLQYRYLQYLETCQTKGRFQISRCLSGYLSTVP
jgi:hypothetical protein